MNVFFSRRLVITQMQKATRKWRVFASLPSSTQRIPITFPSPTHAKSRFTGKERPPIGFKAGFSNPF